MREARGRVEEQKTKHEMVRLLGVKDGMGRERKGEKAGHKIFTKVRD
jgi:hypothetical protein